MEQTVNWEKVYVDTPGTPYEGWRQHTAIYQILRWQDL